MSWVVGIDIGGTAIKGGVVSENGEVLHKDSIPTRAMRGQEAILNDIEDFIEKLISTQAKKDDCVGIGFGMPGCVNDALVLAGGCENIPSLVGSDFSRFHKKFNVQVKADNDANNAARGELSFGAAKGVKNAMVITIGTGIGGGLILNGELFRGSTGYAGEVGHLPIAIMGKTSKTGGDGSFEEYASASAMVGIARQKLKKGIKSRITYSILDDQGAKAIFDAAREGDLLAVRVLSDASKSMGIALSSCVNLLNLDRIVIGGGPSESLDLMMDEIQLALQESCLQLAYEAVKIVPAELKNSAGVIGAASQIFLEK